jgi:DNA-binding GntR family transcriptional regulator
VPRLDTAVLTEIRAAAQAVEASGGDDLAEMTARNRRFHFLLFDAAGMPRLSRTLRQLWDATDVYRAVYFATSENRRRVCDEHAELVAALAAGDAERAVAVQASHRDHSVATVRAAITAG